MSKNKMKKISYEEFKKEIIENISDFVPEAYGNYSVAVKDIVKHNAKYEGLIVSPEGGMTAPIINLLAAYDSYREADLELIDILEALENFLAESRREDLDSVDTVLEDYDSCRTRLFLKMINKDWNEEFLEDKPHTNIPGTDLALTYNVTLSEVASACVTRGHMDKWGITLEELHRDSIANAEKTARPVVSSVYGAIIGLQPDPEESVEGMIGNACTACDTVFDSDDGEDLFYLSTECGNYGASALAYDGILDRIRKGMGNRDFTMLPSSIHEVLIVPDGKDGRPFISMDDYRRMVGEVNLTVDQGDRLSDNIYRYDGEKLEMVH